VSDETDRRLNVPPPSPPGLAIATLVLGILGVVLSPLLLGGLLGLAGLALGVLHLRRRSASKGMAVWGMALALVGVGASVAAGSLYYHLYREVQQRWADAHEWETGDAAAKWVGTTAPNLTLTTLEGENVELAQFTGRPVVVNFWATWCGPCKRELPELNRLAREEPQIVVLGVSDEPAAVIQAFAEKRPFAYRVASLPSRPAPFDNLQGIPTTVFIDRKGVIREVKVGMLVFDEMKERALAPDYAATPTALPPDR